MSLEYMSGSAGYPRLPEASGTTTWQPCSHISRQVSTPVSQSVGRGRDTE